MRAFSIVRCIALLALVAASPLEARAAGTGDGCASASEAAQRLRSEGRLVEARARLIDCSNPACLSFIKQDCDQWLSAVDASMPTVVLSAHDPSGRDLVETHVSVDDVLTLAQLDGRATPMNPGVHTLRFELTGYKTVERTVVVREGEKAREVVVQLEPEDAGAPSATASSPASASTTPTPTPGPPASGDASGSTSPAAYVLGTLGVVGLGASLGLYLSAALQASHLRSTCAPNCAQSDADDISRRETWSGVALGVGLGCVAGAILLFVRGTNASSTTAATTSVEVGPGSVGVRVRF
jgi:hypothetical protein